MHRAGGDGVQHSPKGFCAQHAVLRKGVKEEGLLVRRGELEVTRRYDLSNMLTIKIVWVHTAAASTHNWAWIQELRTELLWNLGISLKSFSPQADLGKDCN
jgi:hypothetical protein